MSEGGGVREIKKGKRVHHRVLGKNRVEFIYDALLRMKQRGVSEAEVFAALTNPDETGLPTVSPRQRIRKRRSPRVAVDVVYEEMTDAIRIITVIVIHFSERPREERLAQRAKRGRKK